MASATQMIPTDSVFASTRSIPLAKGGSTPYGLPIVEKCASCSLRRERFFCGLSPESLRDLDRIKHNAAYPDGALVFVEGQAPRGVYVVCQGRVKMMTTNKDGKTLILKIAGPGEVLGLHSVLRGQEHEMTVETLQATQLAFIGADDFLRFLKGHADACLRAAEHLSRDCQSAYSSIRSIGLAHSVTERLARLLLDLVEDSKVGDGPIRAKLALTHEEISQLIGVSRETVTRSLGDLKKRRVAELKGSTLVVLNKAALEKMAEC